MSTSRPYRVTTAPPVGKTVVAEDHVRTKLHIPPILPPEASGAIMAGVLKGRQFTDGPDGTLVRERDGVKVTVDPVGGDVTVSADKSAEVKPPPSNPSPCGCRMQKSLAEAEAALDREADRARRGMEKNLTRRLEGVIPKIGCELEGVVQQVTKAAILEKARSMGEIRELSEDPKTGAMTVVVEV
jgi:hypothetical protein